MSKSKAEAVLERTLGSGTHQYLTNTFPALHSEIIQAMHTYAAGFAEWVTQTEGLFYAFDNGNYYYKGEPVATTQLLKIYDGEK